MIPANVRKKSFFAFRELRFASGLCLAFGQLAEAGSLAFCIGTGGTGKTTLAKHIAGVIFGERESWPIATQPVVLVGADAVDRGFFTSKSLMKSFLGALHDPFRSSIAQILQWEIDEDLKGRLIEAVSDMGVLESSEPVMREAFVELARILKVRLIIVDEANLLVLTQRGRTPTDYIESLRRLADRIGCCVLLFGTVDMLELMEYSGQVNRRKLKIHLDRMKCKTEDDKDEFLGLLLGLEEDRGYDVELLQSHSDQILDWTYGIPGEIVGLLDRAEMRQLALGAEKLAWSHIEAERQHPLEIARMRWEADLIDRVMTGSPLTQKDRKEIARRRRNRVNPRRVPVGEQE